MKAYEPNDLFAICMNEINGRGEGDKKVNQFTFTAACLMTIVEALICISKQLEDIKGEVDNEG